MPMPESKPSSVAWGEVAVFVALSFGLAWLVALPLWLGDGLKSRFAGPTLMVMMWTPAVATFVVTRFVQRRRLREAAAALGVAPVGPVRPFLRWGLVAIAVGALLPVATLAIAALAGRAPLDVVHLSGFRAVYATQVAKLGKPPELPMPAHALVALQLALIPLGAVFNGLFAFGEEVGWRGWLLRALAPLGTWRALLVSGAIWGLWHSPAVLLGFNFNEPNLLGVLLMTVGCAALGVVFGWLRLESGLVWPAVLAHGALNAAAGLPMLLSAAGAQMRGVDVLVVGWPGWLVCAAMGLWLWRSGRLKPRGAPAAP